ncbi:MAG: hypothetical protein ABSE20_28895, partial [Acetobacteraceae bacterium]
MTLEPQRRNARPGPECSTTRASSIWPNSSVEPWFSTGIRPVSLSTSMKNAAIISRWLGRTTCTALERIADPNAYGRSVCVVSASTNVTKITVGSLKAPN